MLIELLREWAWCVRFGINCLTVFAVTTFALGAVWRHFERRFHEKQK